MEKKLQRTHFHKAHLPNKTPFLKKEPGGNLNRALNNVSDILAYSHLKKKQPQST